MAQCILTTTWQGPGESLSYGSTVSADTLVVADWEVAGETTDQQVTLALDVSALKLWMIYSNVAATLETNAVDATGGNTLTLPAGVAVGWDYLSGFVNLLTEDVTTAYVTVAGATAASIKFRALLDGTP